MLLSDKINILYENHLSDYCINKDDIQIISEHELIALTNFYGTETYYTRGAFLDTVVNQQMLSGKEEEGLKLEDIEYITSILENAGFFLVHNTKSKYIIRVQKTLTKLINMEGYSQLKTNLDQLNKIIDKFASPTKNGINYDINYCKWISESNNEINLLKCEKYEIFNIIFNLVFDILNIAKIKYNLNLNTSLPFYDIFISKINPIFNLDKSIKVSSIQKEIQNIKIDEIKLNEINLKEKKCKFT